MAGLGEAYISVIADTTDLESSLQDGLKAAVARTKLGTVYGSAVAAGVVKAIQAFAPLEKKILEVFQVQGINASSEMFDALAAQIYDVAREIGQPAEAVGAAIALGVGRGFTQEEAVDLSKLAGQLSIALPDTVNVEEATKALTAALNGFNLTAEDSERVAGTLFQTLAKTGAPVGQLAQQIGNLAPAAANAGIGLEETTAAITTLVQGGYTAAEATTQIRTAIIELSDSATTGGKVFKEISGKTFPEYIKGGKTLQEALNLVNDATKGTGFSVSDLTSNYNTQNAIVALTGDATARYTQNLANAKTGTEDMAAAVKTAEQGALFRFNKGINEVKTSFQQVGGALRPFTDMLLARLTPALTWVSLRLQDLAKWISGLDFSGVDKALDRVAFGLQQFGMLFMAVYNILKGANWAAIWTAIQIAAAPVLVVFGLLAAAARVLAEILEFLTPFLREVAEYASYFALSATALLTLVKLFGAWKLALIAARVALFLLGPVIRGVTTAITILRGAMIALSVATGISLLPLYLIVGALAALAAGFIYAWKNSETFRETVVSVVNKVKNAVATGVEFMASLWIGLARAWLTVVANMLEAVGHLPKWMGGGVADGAAAAVRGLIGNLDALEGKIHAIAAAARAANWELDNMLEKAHENAAQQGLWFGNADTNAALQKQVDGFKKIAKKAPNFAAPKTSGLGNLLNPAKDKKAAKDAAKEAAKRLKDSILDLYNDVKKFVRDIGEQSLDSIQSGFENIIGKYNDLIKQATEDGNKTVASQLKKSLKTVQKYQKQIESLAARRDTVTEQLDKATDALKDLVSESANFAKATKQAFVNLGSVAEGSAGIGVTFLGIRNNLRDAIRTTQQFDTAIKKLQALGLNQTSLRQLAEAGPEALDQARALARSGANGIQEINRLQAQLDALAGATASNLNNEFYAAGVSAAQGLVNGLQSQRNAIIAEMDKIAQAMVASIKKELKIKSPSQVMENLFAEVPAGAVQGIRRGTPDVAKAIAAMSAQRGNASIDVGGVTINGVADGEAARRAGILAGDAIAGTLARRKSAQILTGVA